MSRTQLPNAVRSFLLIGLVAASYAVNAQTYKVLYSFAGKPDGANPQAALLLNGGYLYGTTFSGGTSGYGTVFKLTLAGKETVVHSFPLYLDGIYPTTGLIRDAVGNLVGTTYSGGESNAGTVFQVDKSGNETVLYSFMGQSDGAYPKAGLTAVGNLLYGTTTFGCTGCGGAIFDLTYGGSEAVVYYFGSATPYAGLIADSAGNLYGTTLNGGTFGNGTVFKFDTASILTVLYNFAGGTDGADPYAGLIRDGAGNLYGTTAYGGTHNLGTVFKVDKTNKEIVLHSFAGGTDGAQPYASLVRDSAGNLYGTTLSGGAANAGTVFKVDTTGKETVLHRFTGGVDGGQPYAALIRDSVGNLYGTASAGGAHSSGVVFRVTP